MPHERRLVRDAKLDGPVTPEELERAQAAFADFRVVQEGVQNGYVDKVLHYARSWLIPEPVTQVSNTKQLRQQRKQFLAEAAGLFSRMPGRKTLAHERLKNSELTIKNHAYILKDQIGRGGFGVTYRVHENGLPESDILKLSASVDRTDLALSPTGEESGQLFHARQLLVEAAALHKLNGLHAPKLRDAQFVPDPDNKDRRTFLLVMEEIKDPDLFHLPEAQSLEQHPEEAIQLVDKVLRAIQDIHQAGVLHLDLKPEHIFVSPTGEVRVIDFGLGHLPNKAVQQHDRASTNPSSHYAEAVPTVNTGTFSYAPRKYEAPSPKYDVFSLGRVIQRFLYKQSFVDLETRMELFGSLPDSLQPLSRLAERMTTERPADRYSLDQAISELEQSYPELFSPAAVTQAVG